MYPSPAVQAANTEVFITRELYARAPRKIDYRREKSALQDLAACMAGSPDERLPRLVDRALETTGATTGGLSLYEEGAAPGAFRWHFLRGTLAPFEGGLAWEQDGNLLLRWMKRGGPSIEAAPDHCGFGTTWCPTR